ncbi:MAG TPA: sigma-70 family RNA polymerase sigma factor [Phycisphaerae bacterium]|jgi:RNA polymerase sigma factor (sigma-70 family)|nr:sigma-70 family RNA polymerase sigma factor [Phycisphaerae bacterium]HQL54664.1 sigma-70 family RNA polymerase sigma factor [Phycisphaerae bacterium]
MKPTISKAKLATRATTVVRKLNPTAKLPPTGALRRFSLDEIEHLQRRLAEPVECVYHPSFRRATMPEGDLPVDDARSASQASERVTSSDAAPGTEVLTAAAEQRLFLRFNYCRARVMRVLTRYRGQRLSGRAARELLHWDSLAQELRTDIVRANTSLVLAMARRSRNNGVELGELVSEGNLALLRCVDKFDASRGFKFSTYACRAILASFSRAGAKAARHRAQFPAPYDPAMERSDYLETRREGIELDCVDELKRILFENSADLSTVERRVLSARFSLDQPAVRAGQRRKTLDQVGDLLGVSKERVRQIQNQAMLKLRAVLEERLLAAS